MDVIYYLGEASVAETVAGMPDDPAYNTVRNTMSALERKGYLRHRRVGQRYLYKPVETVDAARRSAVAHLINTFFGGSRPEAIRAILATDGRRLPPEALDEIARLVERTRLNA